MALAQTSRPTLGPLGRPEAGGAAAIEWEAALERRGRLRVRTLVQLRWLSVIGQIAAVVVAAFLLKFPLPPGERGHITGQRLHGCRRGSGLQ